MELDKSKIKGAIEKALEDKGKRKFKQSLELILNFRSIDFNKPENRINAQVKLPKGKGKPNKLVIVATDAVAYELKKKFGDEGKFLTLAEAESMSPKEVKALAKDYYFFVEPKLIGQVAKAWGRILGPRGKAPRPLIGKPEDAVKSARDTIRIQNRGKYLPTLQAPIGSEDMSVEDLTENAMTVFEAITKKIPSGNIKNAYVKLTMGKPVKI